MVDKKGRSLFRPFLFACDSDEISLFAFGGFFAESGGFLPKEYSFLLAKTGDSFNTKNPRQIASRVNKKGRDLSRPFFI